jgi:hypothetical protein
MILLKLGQGIKRISLEKEERKRIKEEKGKKYKKEKGRKPEGIIGTHMIREFSSKAFLQLLSD